MAFNFTYSEHYKLVIAGGSAAGNAIASWFSRQIKPSQIAVVEPSEKIFYQPGFTLVAGNLLQSDAVVRNRSDFHPKGVGWIKHDVIEFVPNKSTVVLRWGD